MKYCPKCERSFSDKINFCSNCGSKLETKPGEPGRLVPWIVLALLLLGAILLPTKVVSYQADVPYIEKQQYTVEVPYEAVEEYVVRVPYETQEQYVEKVPTGTKEAIKYTAEQLKCTTSNLSSTGESTIGITNTDSERGQFTINVGYIDYAGDFVAKRYIQTLLPGIPVNLTYSPTPELFPSCHYVVSNIPLKEKYDEVTRERNVTEIREKTRYRNVTKIRNETREKEVSKTRIEKRKKEVNWLFGFDAIVKFRKL